MWTVIPLSSKCHSDKYYFHYDITGLPCSTAKLESMANFSYKRLREPFFHNKKIAHLSEYDYSNILVLLKNITLLKINFSKYLDSRPKISYSIITFRVAHRKMWKLFFKD